MILFSAFGEPAQFAVWLQDPKTGQTKTISVTYRAATGNWKGKAECPVALPRWYQIYRSETGYDNYPTPDTAIPDAVTCATPQSEQFQISTLVEAGSKWLCWIEVNLAADFNTDYPQFDEARGRMDTHLNGQPALLYRAQIHALPGNTATPKIFAKSLLSASGCVVIEQKTDGITTAAEIFPYLHIKVLNP